MSRTQWAAAAGVLLLLGAGMLAAGVMRAPEPPSVAALPTQATTAEATGAQLDSDGDGLSDAAENFLHGSDPHKASTTDNGIPDGWLVAHGLDPSLPGIENRSIEPPPEAMPDAFGGQWPDWMRWRVADAFAAGLDPREPVHPSGIPYAWLVYHGVDPAPGVGSLQLAPGALTVAQSYQSATDPRITDFDGDGLSDADELGQYKTDPRNASTTGSGIPDGWLALHGLDPADPSVPGRDVAGKGMTVQEVYEYNLQRFGDGTGLSPVRMSEGGHGVPDGWLVGHGLDPFQAGIIDQVVSSSQAYPDLLVVGPGAVGTPPAHVTITVGDAYRYGRPATWDERSQGPWRGGLGVDGDSDGDGLPDAVELQGALRTRRVASTWQTYPTDSDPLRADTDGDGLTDGEEYLGRAVRDGVAYVWPPTDPRSPDTAFSGIGDAASVLGDAEIGLPTLLEAGVRVPLLDPTQRDTDDDHIPDGQEWLFWVEAAKRVGGSYNAGYPHSLHKDWSWMQNLPGRGGAAVSAAEARALLGPLGDLDGDGLANVVDRDADGDGLADGWEVDPLLLRFSSYLTGHRGATDPANPDTDGDGLPDEWELRYGRFDQATLTWDLDPSRSHSGPGSSQLDDGQRNLDGDVVHWTAFDGDDPQTRKPSPREFAYTNLLEYRFDTDPRVADEGDDGVSEGWRHFWGREYPARLEADPDGLGDVLPDLADVDERQDDVLNSPADFVTQSLKVLRFSLQQDLALGESVAAGWPKTVTTVDGTPFIYKIEGSRGLDLETIAKQGLNPYLLDTDGDGLLDAFEVFRGTCGGPDPLKPDGTADPDEDGLTNLEEQGASSPPRDTDASTDPCSKDSDLGGVPDGDELGASVPLDPRDDVAAASGNDDDGDGLTNAVELDQGTRPSFVDSDGDGLLDGNNVPFDTRPSPLIETWKALGIARGTTGAGATFLGEKSGNTDPTTFDTAGSGIADGWLRYHGQTNPAGLGDKYACDRPAWWPAGLVWWWGVRPVPSAEPCGSDRDHDGLMESLGEDPVPGAGAGWEPGLKPSDLTGLNRSQAMSWGLCAGDPLPCMQAPPDPPQRAAVVFTDLAGVPGTLVKDVPSTLTGRLVKACGQTPCQPLVGAPHRAVVVEAKAGGFAGVEAGTFVLGVAATSATGAFSVPVCLCAGGSASIGEHVVALGDADGDVSWQNAWDQVAPGQGLALQVRALATTTDFFRGQGDENHAQYLDWDGVHATARAIQSLGTKQVESATILTIAPIPPIPAGQTPSVEVEVRLTDVSGRPLDAKLVAIAAGSAATPVTTDQTGLAKASFTLDGPGSHTIAASFAGSNGALASSAASTVVVQAPSLLEAQLDSEASAGRELRARAMLTSQGQPVQGVILTFRLGAFTGSVTTGANGALITIPAQSVLAGTHDLAIQSAASDALAGASMSLQVKVTESSRLQIAAPARLSPGDALPVTGRLQTDAGQPIAGAAVQILLDGVELALRTTGADGAFRFDGAVAGGAGTRRLSAAYAGDGVRSGASAQLALDVVHATRLSGGPYSGVRGEPVTLDARLVDQSGTGLAGRPVDAFLDGQWFASDVSSAGGDLRLTGRLPADAALGEHPLRLVFAGDPGGTRLGSARATHIVVGDRVTLHVDPLDLRRGDQGLVGHVAAQGGEPLAGVPLIMAPFASSATTAADGSFRLPFTIGPDVPAGPHELSVRVPRHGAFLEATASTTAWLNVTPTLKLGVPATMGRGVDTEVLVVLADDLGRPLAGQVRLEGPGGARTVDVDGTARIDWSVPADAPLGETRFRARSEPAPGHHAAAAQATTTIRDGVRLVISGMPADAHPGQRVDLRLHLTDATGQPLADREVAVAVAGAPAAIVARTGPDGVAVAYVSAPLEGRLDLVARFAGTETLAAQQARAGAMVQAPPPPPPPTWTWFAVAAFALGALAALPALRMRRRPTAPSAAPVLLDAVARIDAGDPWTAAVTICYRRLLRMVALQGIEVPDHVTVRDAAQALASGLGLDPADVQAFVAIVEASAYGSGATPAMAREARSLMHRLAGQVAP